METNLQKIADNETESQQTILKYLRIALSSQIRLGEKADSAFQGWDAKYRTKLG
jgi:hypothetical protein